MNREPLNSSSPFAVVVNDDPTQLKVLSGLVRKAGLEPRIFTAAAAALADMSDWAEMVDSALGAFPAIIITDLYMPGIDGWRFCRLLRSPEYAALNQIPILVVSATFAGDETGRIADDLGAEAFLPSPVDGRRFVEQVHAILSGKRTRTPLRVLIVEDSRSLAALIKDAFVANGYQADTSLTAQAASAAFGKTAYDVAVLDYHLPDGTGDDLLDAFRAQRPDCVCLMMTTDTGPELALDWMKRGAAAYLKKPFQTEYLIELCVRARRERALLRVQDLIEVRTSELRKSEEKHKRMIANISDVIAIMDIDGKLRYESPNIEKWFGWRPEDLVGADGLKTVHPEDTARIKNEFSTLLDRDNSVATVEYRYQCKDGSYKLIELTAVNLTNDPIIHGVLMNYHDITERKLVEKAYKDSEFTYRSLIEHSSDVVFCVDRNGEYKFVNQVFASTFGKTPDYFLGKTFWDIYPKEHADYRQEASSRAFETGESESVEVVVPLPDRTLYFVAKTNPVRDETGNVILNLTHATDITALKRIEAEKAELEAQNRQLQKAESLGRMAGAIAHHFNNQLYAVMGNLEMAMDDQSLGVNSNESLVSAMQAARKAADVSRLMLTYLGQAPGNQEPIDLSETCRQSQSLLQAATPRGIIINTEFPSSGPVIRADTNQMHQVLTNLITNAWESISDNLGAIGLTIKTVSQMDISTLKRFPIDWQPQEIAYTCLEVSDTGCGISNKDIEKIFDPFFTTKFTGRGLGLSVVMGIVKAHGGGVTIESEPGWGSTFRVFLPVSTEKIPCQPDLPNIQGALQTRKTEKISKTEGNGAVLLIEDEDPVRNMAKQMLTRLGYTVLEAKDGVEALEIFQQHQDEICCVLSDLTMPRMDGWETLIALRKLSPDIPVILSSGYDEAQVMAGEHPERPNAFLGKPYQRKGLSDTISRALTSASKY